MQLAERMATRTAWKSNARRRSLGFLSARGPRVEQSVRGAALEQPGRTRHHREGQPQLHWSPLAGVGYEVTLSFTVELAYRYLYLADASTGAVYNYAGQCRTCEALTFKNMDAHDVKFGVRWTPGASTCPAEPAALVRRY